MKDSIPYLRRIIGELQDENESLKANPVIKTVIKEVYFPLPSEIKTVYFDNPAHIETIRVLQEKLCQLQSNPE